MFLLAIDTEQLLLVKTTDKCERPILHIITVTQTNSDSLTDRLTQCTGGTYEVTVDDEEFVLNIQ